MKLLYNKEELFCTKIGLLDFMLTLPLANLIMISVRLGSNGFPAVTQHPKKVR